MDHRKIAVVLVDRANYGRMKPVMQEIQKRPTLEMSLICSGTMVLERFGSPVKLMAQDGFDVDGELYIELEGSTPTTMAKSLGFAVIEFASEFQRLRPDFVLIIGDRYEALAAALAASYMNLCIAHIQGGEVSGSIDESARHCITKLAHYHFPATKRSQEYIIRMGEPLQTVFEVGCPSGDIAFTLDKALPADIFRNKGIGPSINPEQPYILVVFHPVTTYYDQAKQETIEVLKALEALSIQTLWLWPNIDAGSDFVNKAIRSYRENNHADWLQLIKNFTPEDYLRVLANAVCAVGNSSSFVRDASFFGTPVVLTGNRQEGREMAENVLPLKTIEKQSLIEAINKQISYGQHKPSTLYGDGQASHRIADHLETIEPYRQKRLNYDMMTSVHP